ncbi:MULTISPECIES: hypothetical protein [Myxococcaceae]|nr:MULTISPECIES: hypothetical protein [Myxococcaceae]MBF5041669.1 hypothetical protein [Simulacricoccus sp. 17bor-14]
MPSSEPSPAAAETPVVFTQAVEGVLRALGRLPTVQDCTFDVSWQEG